MLDQWSQTAHVGPVEPKRSIKRQRLALGALQQQKVPCGAESLPGIQLDDSSLLLNFASTDCPLFEGPKILLQRICKLEIYQNGSSGHLQIGLKRCLL